MKKLFSFMAAILIVASLCFSASAATLDEINAVRDAIFSIGEVTKDSGDAIRRARALYNALDADGKADSWYYVSILTSAETRYAEFTKAPEEATDGNFVGDMINDLEDSANSGFALFRSVLKDNGKNMFYLSCEPIVSGFMTVFMPMGVLIMLISWCISLGKKITETGVDGVSPQTVISAGISLFAGLMLIVSSDAILLLITKIADNLSASLLTNDILLQPVKAYHNILDLTKITSKIPIIGPLISIISAFVTYSPANLVNLGLMLTALIANVILGIRIIKLTVMRSIAPLFVGMAAGEATRPYSANFFLEYIILALQVVLLDVFYIIFQSTYVNVIMPIFTAGEFNFAGLFSVGIIMIVFIIMCLKSESFLRKILHR